MPPAEAIDILGQYGWILGEEDVDPDLWDAARHGLETRVLAALFKRRWQLLIRWRLQSQAEARIRLHARSTFMTVASRQNRASADGDIMVTSDLPRSLPPLRGEIAILRAFLAREIDAILFESP